MFPVLKKLYPNSNIKQGKILSKKIDGVKVNYEYDYIVTAEEEEELLIVELKGYKATSVIPWGAMEEERTCAWFFKRTFPFAKNNLGLANSDQYKVRASFITTAKFDRLAEENLGRLNQGKLKSSKLNVGYDGKALLELMDTLNLNNVRKILKKYYLTDKNINEVNPK
jgi:hypothetical protein